MSVFKNPVIFREIFIFGFLYSEQYLISSCLGGLILYYLSSFVGFLRWRTL